MKLTKHLALKYASHINLNGFDFEKQEMLLNANVLIVGMGGLGCYVAHTLCLSGVNHISIVDHDTVQLSNLSRQFLYNESDIEKPKVHCAQRHLQDHFPDAKIAAYLARFSEFLSQHYANIDDRFDVVLDCTDNINVRLEINQFSVARNLSLVSGAAIRTQGQLYTYTPPIALDSSREHTQTACFECVSQYFTEQELSCSSAGVFTPVVGIVGNFQALEALKLISNYGRLSAGKLKIFDGLTGQWQSFTVKKNASCRVCRN